MNIILLSNDLQETDLLQQELGKLAPTIQIEVRHSAQEATSHISASNPCDAILLDASFPREDAVNLVLSIRREKKPIGIVALADTADKNPPIDLFKAGVDNFILKRPGYHSQLEEALKQAKERHKADTGPHARQSHVLYAGDTKKIQPHLAGVPHLHVVSVAFAPDGLLKIPQTGSPQNAVLIIDSAACSGNPLNAVKDVNLRVPELPIIFLSEVDDEQGLIQAMRAGASDCIAKTEGYLQRLTHAIEREVKHRESVLEKTALRAREERLRQIVENIPVGVTVIAPDGTFMAVNRAGLKLMGAVRLEQLVGKNFLQLLSREEQEKTLAFLSTISRGVSASVRLDWKGLDGTIAGMELRAVPMRRDAAGTTAALAAIYPPGGLRSAAVSDDASQNRQEEMISALQESEARLRELQDNSNLDRLKHEEALRQLETRCAAADQQLAVLTNSIAEYEARNKSLLEEQQAERASWEMTREGLKEQCAKIETMAESLRSAQDSLVETHSAERTQWQSKLQELESRRQEAEERLAQISELHNSDTSRQDEIQRDLDQRIHEAELTRSNLEAALQDVEARLARQMEALAAERELREIARQESSHKIGEAESLRAALEASLREADARFTQLAEELNTERSLHESARLGFEQKIQEAENTRAALEASLREVDARFTQQAEELNTERSLHESARLEFEQKIQEVENTRAALEESLREADARFTQQAEELNAERSLHQSARLEFEQKIQEAENTRAALEASLREADARFTQQAEELNTERSLRESARLEFEQKIQEVENTRAALEASLR
jgi:PAS domain S-box-containing protein